MSEDAALSQLRSELLLRLTELSGDVRLILQRMDQMDGRAAEHGSALARLDDRVDKVEATTVTRAEMNERSKRTLQLAAIIVALLGAATGSGTALLIAAMTNGG